MLSRHRNQRTRSLPVRAVVVGLAAVLAAAAASGCGETDTATDTKVTLLTHDSFVLPQPVLDEFTKQTGLTLQLVTSGDAGQLASAISLTPGKPKADAVYGIDNTFASRPIKAGALDPYTPATATTGAADYTYGNGGELTAIDHSDVCVNVDPAWYRQRGQTPPTTIEQLTDPRYRGQMVALDPATSSPGLAFLFATIAAHPGDWQAYWGKLRANDVQIVSGWETAYNQEFSGAEGKGPKPIVVSYSSSPADNTATTALLDGCFRQVEYAGVLRGAGNTAGARKAVDFLLSDAVQRALPENDYVYPVQDGVPLPDSWAKFAPAPQKPLSLPEQQISDNREQWQQQWRTVMGR
ncbi:thiamine ABC transporter substrate-binding protein [Williamsia sterculiae]|uniref:Thiamine transport system substrate-binding protein n=1 Tax=Williamsia sterculiae TaxID=1344003 RepID=A0A1N7FSE2_9NOCA|nr:thiamine ABC transporter substrate-binding protein [Williamsia sterculiae]SIS03165.1 thiamine transport system substrate-binding protein [Williamsia sterculiae]